MTSPEPRAQVASAQPNGTTHDLELDVTKLHSLPTEQQDIFLLSFVSDLLQHVQRLDKDALPKHQTSIKKEVIKIIGLSAPLPSRPIRNNLGLILADTFKRGSRSLLYETINDLLAFVNAAKGEKELKNRHAAVVALGHIFLAAGDSAFSLSSLTCSSLVKLLKQSQNHAGLRASIYDALGQIAIGLGVPLDEGIARDIWKHARADASNDKILIAQKAACVCIQRLFETTAYMRNSNDFEHLKVAIFRAVESESPRVRTAAASCLALVLAQAYRQKPVETIPQLRKPKKAVKKQAQDGQEDEETSARPGSPAPKRPATQLSLTFIDMCRTLSIQFCKPSTSNRARAGLVASYKKLFHLLPDKTLEDNYGSVAEHFFMDILNHPSQLYNRHRLLLSRKFVAVLLEDVIGRDLLSENGQINAARWLVNGVLKNYPKVVQERPEPPKRTLAAALSAVASLATNLGSAFSSIGEICRDALFQVLQHTNYTVSIGAARCLRALASACPHLLMPCVTFCTTRLQKELSLISGPGHSHRRCIAYAHALSALTSIARFHPLYISPNVFHEVLGTATSLLKSSSGSELRVSATQIQVAWILIGGLMPLGPNFAKVHLSQLLLLWRNALPRPLTRENAGKRGTLETSFLAHVRDCALGAMLVFLKYNGSLVTLDGSRKLTAMLQNTVVFLESLPSQRHHEELSTRLIHTLQLQDFVIMVRRRVLQCFSQLFAMNQMESSDIMSQSSIVNLAISCLAEPERSSPRSLDTSLGANATNFESLWSMTDNWAYGVNALLTGYDLTLFDHHNYRQFLGLRKLMPQHDVEIEDVLLSPIISSFEHDSLLLYSTAQPAASPAAVTPASQVVNAAIELFAIALPLQPPRVQESSLEQLATLAAQQFPRDPGRKAAMSANIATAMLGAMMVANRETNFDGGRIAATAIEKAVEEMVAKFISDQDPYIRNLGAEAIGRLGNLAGSQFIATQVKGVIDMIVANRDPNVRAGCALSLGCIHSHIGGMAAGFHLKTIVSVLLSLCSDEHPTVHFWAMHGLCKVADSAGLTFSSYMLSTLGMLAQLYMSDAHSEESGSFSTSNMEIIHPTPLQLAQNIDALFTVLGPDLQDMSKARGLLLTMTEYVHREDPSSYKVEALICSSHLSMFAPAYLDFELYVKRLQEGIASTDNNLREVCIENMSNLVRKDVRAVLVVSGRTLEDQLWAALDDQPQHATLRGIIRSWLQQTFSTDTVSWIKQCQNILSKTRVKKNALPVTAVTAKDTAASEVLDEEVAGFAAAAAAAQGENADPAAENQEFLKWQTRTFAMSCLSELIDVVEQASILDQSNPAEESLQSKIADVVRLAFTASTAGVVELRVLGLRIIDQLLKLFGRTPDPDFTETSLLEQYQAQIGSAMTPAFAADSSPELAAQAISVCATFVATGIVTSVERMGRIFKLLVISLENIKDKSDNTTLGDLKNLSQNAKTMLKMSALSAWAQLQIASLEQPYLEEIVQPYAAKLTPLWLTCLQEYAQLRFEPEISSSLGDSLTGNVSELYAALTRQTCLRFYQDSWLSLVEAIAIIVDKDSEFVIDALDGKLDAPPEIQVNGVTHTQSGKEMSFREEPVAFFFILYGLAFEALATQFRADSSQIFSVLQALKKILRPAVAGNAVYQDTVFSESMDLLDRLALTEGTATQGVLVETARNLSLNHVSANATTDRNDKLSDDIEQLFELTRLMILILARLLTTLDDPPRPVTRPFTDDSTSLIVLTLEALVDVAKIFPSVIRGDLHACVLHTFCTILATGLCQAAVVPQILPIFKRFLLSISSLRRIDSGTSRLVRGTLARFLQILTQAQKRENEYAVLCAKNTLLATTILLTTASAAIPPNDEALSRTLKEIMDSLHDLGLAKIAANCIRSLLLTTPKTTTDEVIATMIIPSLLRFVVDDIADEDDPENVLGLIVHALTSSVATFPLQTSKAAAVSMLIPALLTRAQAAEDDNALQRETASRMLELAGYDAQAFRGVVLALDAESRAYLQDMLRAGRGQVNGGQALEDGGEDSKPAIELRMDF